MKLRSNEDPSWLENIKFHKLFHRSLRSLLIDPTAIQFATSAEYLLKLQ